MIKNVFFLLNFFVLILLSGNNNLDLGCIDYDHDLNKCHLCIYDHYNMHSGPFISENQIFGPNFCSSKINLEIRKEIYVDSRISCENSCIGTENSPFESLFLAFSYIMENFKSYNFSSIIIYLMNEETHYFYNTSDQVESFFLLRRMNINLTITPLFCDHKNISGCVVSETYSKIVLKSQNLYIFVSNQLNINNIIFNGIDLSLSNWTDEFYIFNLNKTICSEEDLTNLSNDSVKKGCYIKNKRQGSTTMIYGFLVLEPFFDCEECPAANLNIKNCEFRVINSIQNWVSLISIYLAFPINISIKNTIFTKCYFNHGIISLINNFDFFYSISLSSIKNYMDRIKDKSISCHFERNTISYFDYFNLNNENNSIILVNFHNSVNYNELPKMNLTISHDNYLSNYFDRSNGSFIFISNFSTQSSLKISNITLKFCKINFFLEHKCLFDLNLVENSYFLSNFNAGFYFSERNKISFKNNTINGIILQSDFILISNVKLFISDCFFENISSFDLNISSLFRNVSPLLLSLKIIFNEGNSKNLTFDEITFKNCSFKSLHFTDLLNSIVPLQNIFLEDCSFLTITLLLSQSLIDCYIENLILFKRVKFEKIIGNYIFYSRNSRNRIFEEVWYINSQAAFLYIVGSFFKPSLHYMKLSLTKIIIENITLINENDNNSYSLIGLYVDYSTDNSDVIFRQSFLKNVSFFFKKEFDLLIFLNNPYYVWIYNVITEEISNSGLIYFANYADAPIVNITRLFIINKNVSSSWLCCFYNINFILIQKCIFYGGEKNILQSAFFFSCYPNCYLVFIDNRISKIKSSYPLLYVRYQNIKRIIFKNCTFDNNGGYKNSEIKLVFKEKIKSLYENRNNLELMFDNYFIFCQNLVNLTEYLLNKSQCLARLQKNRTNDLLSIGELKFFNVTEWNYLIFTYGFLDCLFSNGSGGASFATTSESDCLLKNVSFYNYQVMSNMIFISDGKNNFYLYELKIINGSSYSDSYGSVFFFISDSYAYVRNSSIHNITSKANGAVFYIIKSTLELVCVNIENSLSQNGGIIYSLEGKNYIKNVSIKNSIAKIMGGAIYSKLSDFYLNNTLIVKCFSNFDGGAFYIEQNKNFEVKTISIENSFAERSALIFIKGGEVQNYYFENFSCVSNSGKNSVCIYAKEGKLFINSSNIFNNTGYHSLIYSSSSFSKISIQINNASFHFNKVNKYLIYSEKSNSFYTNLNIQNEFFAENAFFFAFSDFHLDSIKIIITNENIIQNIKPLYAIFAFSSSGLIINSYFDFSSNSIGAILNDNSFLEVFLNKFLNNKGILGGVIRIMSLLKTSIGLNFFCNNLAEYGGAIYAFNSLIVIKDNFFVENYGKFQGSDIFVSNVILESGEEIQIFNNVFNKFYYISSVFIDIISLQIDNNSFFGNSSANVSWNNNFTEYNQAIYCDNVLLTVVKNSYISNINGLSAFQFTNNNPTNIKLYINSTIFVNCSTSLSGGGLSLFGNFNLTILNCKFLNNFALMDGGAIYVDWRSGDSFLYYLKNNTFENNLAKLYGGALKFSIIDLEQLSLLKNKFISNKANIGDNICTNAAKLYLSSFDISPLSNSQNLSRTLDLNESLSMKNISSGQNFELYISIFDHLNNFLIYENLGEITIEIQKNSDGDYAKKYENINLLNSIVKVKSGVGAFTSMVFIGEPGQTYLANIKYTKNNISITSTVNFNVIHCKIGEIYFNSKCILCPIGFYSLEENSFASGKDSCDRCPSDAHCSGGNSIIPLKGFWRLDSLSLLMIRCVNPENCPNQLDYFFLSRQNYSYICQFGTYGNLCFNCINGFGKNSNGLCGKCSSETFLYIKFFGFFTFTLILLLYQSIVALKSDEDQVLSRSLIKILINHNYYLTFLGNLKLEWFGNVKDLLTNTDIYMTSVSKDIMNFDCFIDGLVSQESIPILKLVLFSFFPLMMFFCISILRIFFIITEKIYRLFHKNLRITQKKSILKEMKRVIYVCFIVTIYNFYSRITANTLKLLKCINLDQTSRTFLEIDPNIECWVDGGFHYLLLKTLFLLNFVLWCLGWPILILWILIVRKYKAKKRIMSSTFIGKRKKMINNKRVHLNFEIKMTNEIHTSFSKSMELERNKTAKGILSKNIDIKKSSKSNIKNELLNNHFATQNILKNRQSIKKEFQKSKIIRFLTSDYRSNFYYWEVILYFFNLTIVILNVTTSHIDANPQGKMFMLLYFLMLVFVEIKKPFKYRIINELASLSYLSLVFTIGFILIILTDNQPLGFQQQLYFSIIIIFNGFFYLKWFAIFAKIIFDRYLKHLKVIFEIFRKTFKR